MNILTPALLPDFSRSLWMTSNMKMQLEYFKFDLLEMDIQQISEIYLTRLEVIDINCI